MFFDRVFGVEIGDLCYDHDAAYLACTLRLKIIGDWRLFKHIWQRGNLQEGWRNGALKTTAAAMYAAVSTFGWGFWIKTLWEEKWSKQ